MTIHERATQSQETWSPWPLTQVIQRLVRDHRRWRTDHLPFIDYLFDLAQDLPESQLLAGIGPLRRAFRRLREEMEGHMCREENVLFPAIVDRERAAALGGSVPRTTFGSLRNPIGMMEQEHRTEQHLWAELRTASGEYWLPDDAPAWVQSLFDKLQALEKSVSVHARLENQVLFAHALSLECLLKHE